MWSNVLNLLVIIVGLYSLSNQLLVHVNREGPANSNLLMAPNSDFKFTPGILNLLSFHKHQKNRPNSPRNPLKSISVSIALLVMLTQSGDVHPNPGPYKPKFPCLLCGKAAKWNQRAVACDECHGWYHVDCMSMSTANYNVLAEHNSLEWICCQCGMPNFSSSLFNNSDFELSNSFESLSSIHSQTNSSCKETCSPEFAQPN